MITQPPNKDISELFTPLCLYQAYCRSTTEFLPIMNWPHKCVPFERRTNFPQPATPCDC